MPVDVMAGEYDPANHFMPQQPLHKCMFPKALSYPTVKSVTNPYEAAIGGIRWVKSSVICQCGKDVVAFQYCFD